MLRLLLLTLAGICATQAQLHVQIEYSAPHLRLHLPDVDKEVRNVVFHYIIRGTIHTGVGVHTILGWEFKTDVKEEHVDSISAYADVHYRNGLAISTARTLHAVDTQSVIVPGGRRVRAVLFREDFTQPFDPWNMHTWKTEVSMFGGRNWEFQVYTNDAKNVFTRDGNLFLYPVPTVNDPRFDENFLKTGTMDVADIWGICTNDADYGCSRSGNNGMLPPVMSGKVSSQPAIRYGTVEVRARIPRGDWLWPAIWMMPKNSVYGVWPRSGELDIMETRGNAGPPGVQTVTSTFHWGDAWNNNKWSLTHGEKSSPAGTTWHDAFHTWKIERTADHIITSIDDQTILSVNAPPNGFWQLGGLSSNIWASGSKIAPFDQDFYLILNVAVGGINGYFSDTENWGVKKPWANNSPHANLDFWNARNDWLPTWQGDQAALQVDYVEFRD
ncbi:hypothetical protein BsWGS_15820 [Bradybaena similaris]